MYPTTPAYNSAVYASSRKVIGRVTFDISDVTAAGDVSSITATSQASSMLSDVTQINNNVRDQTYKLATLEPGRFKLDGTFAFADSVTPANNGERGYVSSNLCAADGTFATYPTITISFSSTHSSAGLTVTFDALGGEYATDYSVAVYDAADALITSVDVTGNTDVMDVPLGQLAGYKKIILTIKKWSVGNRRARVVEVDFGFVVVYTGDSLIGMTLTEEVDVVSGSLPSPEFTFTVDNQDRRFNILNPTGFYTFLQQRQQVVAELGVEFETGEVEYVPVGNYLLWEWASDEGALTATFTARTNLDLMDNYSYEQTTASSKTLYQLAVDIFASCGITNYSIDTALMSITTNSLADKTTCRDMLHQIALAGQANVFVTRDSIITIKQLVSGAAVDEMSLDNCYAEPKVELVKTVKSVTVEYWMDINTSEIETVTDSNITQGDTVELTGIKLINSPAQAVAVANWILSQSALRTRQTVNWRGNPAHELGDNVIVGNKYDMTKTGFVTRSDLRFQGYLRATTESRGG